MVAISPINGSERSGLFARAYVRYQRDQRLLQSFQSGSKPSTVQEPTRDILRQVTRLREALQALRPRDLVIRSSGVAEQVQLASAVSDQPVDFGPQQATSLRSTEQINTSPTSFSREVEFVGPSNTVGWTGNSESRIVVGGEYDGTNGTDQLTVTADSGGTIGQDDLQFSVRASDGSLVHQWTQPGTSPANSNYTMANGISLAFGEGTVAAGDSFRIDVAITGAEVQSVSANWQVGTSSATIGGIYLGSNGTGDLRFEVASGGVRGVDDMSIDVYAPDGSLAETIAINAADPVDRTYTLNNGLTLELSSGTLITGESFLVAVDSTSPFGFGPSNPEWNSGTANFSVAGTYDGSNGFGALKVVSAASGTIGQDNLAFDILDSTGTLIEQVAVSASSTPGDSVTLTNGLSLSFSAGTVLAGESFEINVAPTGSFFTTPAPALSSAGIVLDGTYNGNDGTGQLRADIVSGGILGQSTVTVDLFDPTGSHLQTLEIPATAEDGDRFSLLNGINLTLGSGELRTGESFLIDVFHQVPESVNPNAAFNAVGNDAPLWEPGTTVVAGQFSVNGVSIDVAASDSINSVLSKINNRVPDVLASFDAATESVVLTRQTANAGLSIQLGSDTSGFVAATKLQHATPVTAGSSAASKIADVAAFSDIVNGSLLINGVEVSVDRQTDLLADVVERINLTVSGVAAEFDSEDRLLTISATDRSPITLDSNGTGFFENVGVSSGTYEAQVQSTGAAVLGPFAQRFATESIDEIAKRFNQLLLELPLEGLSDLQASFSEAVATTLTESQLPTGLVTFDSDELGSLPNVLSDADSLAKVFQSASQTRSLRELLFGQQDGGRGLVDELLRITKSAEQDLSLKLGAGIYSNRIFQ